MSLEPVAAALTALLLAAIVAAYAGLMPIGQWQDEFQTFPLFLEQGWEAVWQRVLRWSPRPVSEVILFGYAHLAAAAGAPLIPHILALLWLLLAAGVLLVPFLYRRSFGSTRHFARAMLLALALYCLFLAGGHPVGEFFYWPQSAAAYVPALAGIVAAMWMVLLGGRGDNAAAHRGIAASLSVAALSAEVAAIFVLVLCALALGLGALARWRRQAATHYAAFVRTLLVPVLVSVGVVVLVALARVGSRGEIFGDPAVAHHVVPSLAAGAVTFARELLLADPGRATFGSLFVGVAGKLSFFAAAYLVLRPLSGARHDRSDMALLFGLACLATMMATIAAAYYQFGVACCQRHGTFRQTLLYVGILALAAAAAYSRPPGAQSGSGRVRGNPIMYIAVATLLPAAASLPGLVRDYRTFDLRLEVSRSNWAAGKRAADRMVYLTIEPGRVAGGLGIPEGTYSIGSDAPGSVPHIISFFQKKEITFRHHASRAAQPQDQPPFEGRVREQPSPRCVLDLVNGRRYAGGGIPRDGPGTVTLQGWTAPHESVAPSAFEAWIAMRSPAGVTRYYRAIAEERADVADALRRSHLVRAGFRITLDASDLEAGSTLTVLSVSGGNAYRCALPLGVQ